MQIECPFATHESSIAYQTDGGFMGKERIHLDHRWELAPSNQ